MNVADKKSVEIIITDDGSTSLYVPTLNETYHSKHGAMAESTLVYIENGMKKALQNFDTLSILEIGLGTGLNAWLTCNISNQENVHVHYTALEIFPLKKEIYSQLNFASQGSALEKKIFNDIHASPWNEVIKISETFKLEKMNVMIQNFDTSRKFNLVYYDAFGPPFQPEMWEKDLFMKIKNWMVSGGILVTYCAKGQVRRDMQECGFEMERLAGPKGKREMLRGSVIGI